MQFDSRAVHAGREDLTALGVHVPPIDQSTTSPLPDVELGGASYELLAGGSRPGSEHSAVYQRLWNPTVARFEDALATMEGADEAVAFATGMAAVCAAVLACVQAGTPHIVAVRPLYGGTDHVLGTGLLGSEVTWARPEEVAGAITDRTGLVICETPANPTLDLIDLRELVAAAGSVPVLVDNTFATPVLQNPIELGASLVLHSLTKYIGGHGDVMGGAIAAGSQWAGRLRSVRAVTGALLTPQSAYLCHRGLQTLPVRVRAQQESAKAVASWLAEHPAVDEVFFPGRDPRDAALLERQMAGPGAMVSFTLRGGYRAASTVAASTSMIVHAVSLGGVDSLIQHPAALTHRPVPAEARPSANLLRLSVGLESLGDIIDDLARALAGLTESPTTGRDHQAEAYAI